MLSQSTNERMNEKFEIYTQRARPNGLIKRTQAQTQTHTERNFFSKSSYKKKIRRLLFIATVSCISICDETSLFAY